MSNQGFREPWTYWSDYCEEEEKGAELLPVCEWCGKTIRDDEYYEINDEIVCEDCVRACRKDTDDYVEKQRRYL